MDSTGQSLAYVYTRQCLRRAHCERADNGEARRIASNIAKLPSLLTKKSRR